jgi:pimeloyl-ACP methyl ester carboxylesterase
MITPRLPRLTEVSRTTPSRRGGKRKVIVFVHGIFSSASTFAPLVASFANDNRFDGHDLATYDYDWGEPLLMSGRRLRDILNARLSAEWAEVTLVGHSMGGLVSRFALIGGHLPSVRRIFMLGTPNFGAMSAARLSTLWQIAVESAGAVTPIFPRKRGLKDLTQVQTIYRTTLPDAPARAQKVEYVTLPGLYYHKERRDTDPGPDRSALPFTVGTLAVKVMSLWPYSEIEIERPHDGIVEESSVSLIPRDAGLLSEKNSSIQDPTTFGRTYCHATPISALDRTHMTIHRDDSFAEAIKGIVLADNVVAWRDALSPTVRQTFQNIEIP